jgi:hypothetical protein
MACYAFVVILLALVGCGAVGNIEVMPGELSVPFVRKGPDVFFVVWVFLSGNDTLQNSNEEGGLVSTFDIINDERLRLPRGLGGYFTEMCIQPCVATVNKTTLKVVLQHAPFFDLRLDQKLQLTIAAVHFNDFRTRIITIPFTKTSEEVSGAAYGLGVPYQLVDVVSLLLFPALHDSRTVIAYVSSPCTTMDQVGWLPGSPYFLSVFGGDVYSRGWRFFVACGSVLTVILIVLLVTRNNQLSLLISRAFIPLLLAQLTCFFLPSLLFGAGFMVSYGAPSHQVFGAFILIYVAVTSVACFTIWIGDKLRRYIPHIVENPSLPPRLRFLTKTGGYWMTPRFSFLTLRDAESNWMVFPERYLLPSYLADTRHDKAFIFMGLHMVCFLFAGVQMGTPILCFMQACILSFLHFVMCIWTGLYMKFRSTPIRVITAILHLNSAFMLGMLAAFPTDAILALFLTGAGLGLVLGLARIVIWCIILFKQDSPRTAVPALGAAPILTPVEPLEDGEGDSDKEMPLLGDHHSDESSHRSRHLATAGTPLQRTPDVSDAEPSSEEVEEEEFDLATQTEDKRTPRYLLTASPLKPKPRREERLRIPQPMWFPQERPNVRTTDDPDNELKLAPYRVRKT